MIKGVIVSLVAFVAGVVVLQLMAPNRLIEVKCFNHKGEMTSYSKRNRNSVFLMVDEKEKAGSGCAATIVE